MKENNKTWWKEAIVYQIYPRSYKDTTGDGIGDLQGIIEKLDYIKSLGVDVIWLNPIYDSPNKDMGYDISDYKKIRLYGGNEKFKVLIKEAHRRGLKILMDLVVNHTSDQHKWFLEAKKSKDNPYRDYYIWRDKKPDGSLPNNWESYFGGSAWEYNEATDDYYLNLFSPFQPDLNWENEKVRKEVKDIMRFWLDQGIDGFRMDVISFISKDPEFKDRDLSMELGESYANGPKLHEYLNELYNDVLRHYNCMTVGECPGIKVDEALQIVGEDRNELQTLFQFDGMFLEDKPGCEFYHVGKWKLQDFKEVYTRWHHHLYSKAWNSIYLMNHDQPRSVSRFGNDKAFRKQSAKMLAVFQLTMCGTPYIYQGEEIGMTNCPFERNEFRDIQMINYYEEQLALGKEEKEFMPGLLYRGRDNSRTPMQWDAGKNAGFSLADETWIKVNPNYHEINVEEAQDDHNSIVNFYKKMIKIRKQNEILVYGDYRLIDEENKAVYAFERILKRERIIVILNFKGLEVDFDIPFFDFKYYEILINNYQEINLTQETEISLKPYQALVLKKRNDKR